MKTYEVCENVLNERIAKMKAYIKKAEGLLAEGDLIQAAVRLDLAAKEAHFDTLMMNVFDSVSIRE